MRCLGQVRKLTGPRLLDRGTVIPKGEAALMVIKNLLLLAGDLLSFVALRLVTFPFSFVAPDLVASPLVLLAAPSCHGDSSLC